MMKTFEDCLGKQALVVETKQGFALSVWGRDETRSSWSKLCVPDRSSRVSPGDRVRLVRLVRDTKPEDPKRGVAFWHVERLGRYGFHRTSGGFSLLVFAGTAGMSISCYRCAACGATVASKSNTHPEADCTASDEDRGRAAAEMVRHWLVPSQWEDGRWVRRVPRHQVEELAKTRRRLNAAELAAFEEALRPTIEADEWVLDEEKAHFS